MTRVWLIDDQLDANQAMELFKWQAAQIELQASSPDDDNFSDLLEENWDLILVDEELWPNETDRFPPEAIDGVSLVAGMRAWARSSNKLLPPLAILTSHEGAFENEPPAIGASRPVLKTFPGHESIVSPVLDIDALLSKHDLELGKKAAELARSYSKAVDAFKNGGISFTELYGYLDIRSLDGPVEFHKARLRESRPPINEENSNDAFPARGRAIIISWLLSRALPFPGLFISDLYVAQTLGVDLGVIDGLLEDGNLHGDKLRKCVYQGPVSSLVERRFWSSAVDLLVADLPDERKDKAGALGLLENQLLRENSTFVVVIDETLSEVDLVDVEEAVRVSPKGWPSEAFQPWMKIDRAKSKEWLATWVDKADRSRLGD